MEKGGGDINKAKEYNNVINPHFLDVPLEKVGKNKLTYKKTDCPFCILDLSTWAPHVTWHL